MMASMKYAWIACLSALTLAAACDLDGGLNQNEQGAGNQEDGTNLWDGDIAVDPSGAYFLTRSGDRLLYSEIARDATRMLKGLANPERVLFGAPGEIFVTEDYPKGDFLVAYDVVTETPKWRRDIEIERGPTTNHGHMTFPKINLSNDAETLVVANPRSMELIRTRDGETIRSGEFSRLVVDVDVLPDDDRVVFTLDHEWDGDTPETKLVVLPMAPSGDATVIKVPNCSDELAVSPDGDVAFLAPTTCQHDPISVIDLDGGEFVRNLPGFGPVALAPGGRMMVGFMDVENLDEDLFDDPSKIPDRNGPRYHLMLIDTRTLDFDTVPVGDALPRYAVTRDGKIVLVDADDWFEDGRIRVLDVETKTLEAVSGPDVRLEHWVQTSDSQRIYLLDAGLFTLSIPERLVESVAVAFTPQNLNLTPDDAFLLLRENHDRVWVYDTVSGQMLRSVSGGGRAPTPDQASKPLP
ncbi:MAG: hypothetical protein D6705_09935 [Deltaproteobacteria bacterium]|nr:MAG: hypothetical protein D6705_09935 [Deltaproteobacteria bacterium]